MSIRAISQKNEISQESLAILIHKETEGLSSILLTPPDLSTTPFPVQAISEEVLDISSQAILSKMHDRAELVVKKEIPPEEIRWMLMQVKDGNRKYEVPPKTKWKQRRILEDRDKNIFVLWNRKHEVEPVGSGAQKKAVFASNLQTGEVKFVVIMGNNPNGSRQLQVMQRVQKEIAKQKEEGVISPVLESFVVKAEDSIFYCNNESNDKIAVFQEWMNGGELKSGMDKGLFDAEDAWDITLQLLEGVSALHEAGIYMRDLRERNILWNRDQNDGKIRVKINDFDLSCFNDSPIEERARRPGSRYHSCFEYFTDPSMSDHLDKQDVWGLAMVLYRLATRQDFPWYNEVISLIKRYQVAMSRAVGVKEKTTVLKEHFLTLSKCIEKHSLRIDYWFPQDLKRTFVGTLIYQMLAPYHNERMSAKDAWKAFLEASGQKETKEEFAEFFNENSEM